MRYILSLSYGKDSLKMLDVVVSRGLPLDLICTFDVWATDTISADLPDVIDFKKRIDKYIFDTYGYNVVHLCSRYPDGTKVTYEREFYRVLTSGKRAGSIVGFPFLNCPWCNSLLKLRAGNGFFKSDDIFYVGICYDEVSRYSSEPNKLNPLVDFQIDEDLCGLFCQFNDILSPSYSRGYRDGCWFCHNQSITQLRFLYYSYPDLWSLLLKWDLDSPVSFFPDGHCLLDYDKRFLLERFGFVSSTSKFRWNGLENYDFDYLRKITPTVR